MLKAVTIDDHGRGLWPVRALPVVRRDWAVPCARVSVQSARLVYGKAL